MFDSIWSFLGWQTAPAQLTPPPVTITGVRFPADGTSAHLLPLTTTSVSGNVDCFLFHVPDLRQYWKTDKAWSYRDLQRIELQQQRHSSCDGLYYAFFSIAMDDLPENSFVPSWVGHGRRSVYWGDVFLVKMAPHEWGEHGWAAYEDIAPEFLDLLVQGPSGYRWGQKRGF